MFPVEVELLYVKLVVSFVELNIHFKLLCVEILACHV